MNPLLAFKTWYLAQAGCMQEQIASSLLPLLPDAAAGLQPVAAHAANRLLNWLDRHMKRATADVVCTAVVLRSFGDHFFLCGHAMYSRGALMEATASLISLRHTLPAATWASARAGWRAMASQTLSDIALDAWLLNDLSGTLASLTKRECDQLELKRLDATRS